MNTDLCVAAESASGGFLDADDLPPWGTWFAHIDRGEFGGIIACWVPAEWVPAADRASYVIPVQCVWWDDGPPPGQ